VLAAAAKKFYDIVVQVAIIRPADRRADGESILQRRMGREPITYPRTGAGAPGVPFFRNSCCTWPWWSPIQRRRAEELRRAMGLPENA
jgi:hypothetical protein